MSIVHLAFDDTDSRKGGGCTTYLAHEALRFLSEHGFTPLGYPRLVRLNPTIPYKTRGNGAVLVSAVHGRVPPGAGMIPVGGEGAPGASGAGISALSRYDGPHAPIPEPGKLLDDFVERVEPFLRLEDPMTNPGFILSTRRPPSHWYGRGLHELLSRDDVEEGIKKIGAVSRAFKKGRGLVGAFCAMAWVPGPGTFELLTYRHPSRWGTPRTIDRASLERMDHEHPSTFDNIDHENNDIKVLPSSPCPVLSGVRGTAASDLPTAAACLEYGEEPYRWTLFETNQATDDHLRPAASLTEMVPYSSYIVRGRVKKAPVTLKGGHVILTISDTHGAGMDCAAYEQTKQFRNVVRELRVGDELTICGSIREKPPTLNIEKMRVDSLATIMEKVSNPLCPDCSIRMTSVGRGKGYRCKRCGKRSDRAVLHEAKRNIHRGWYEAASTARRHLARPLSMGTTHLDERIRAIGGEPDPGDRT